MDSIAILIPYFGKMPGFYWAWEVTALSNETIDFFVITDSYEVSSKKNIHVIGIHNFTIRRNHTAVFSDIMKYFCIYRHFEIRIVIRSYYLMCS